jgi:hypothetical protein
MAVRVRPFVHLAVTAAALAAPHRAAAQEAAKPAAMFTVAVNQDNFFGFYPTFAGTYQVGKQTDFAFYGILWSIPAFGLGGGGQNLWTEFGVGARFRASGDKLAIKPQLGVLNGSLLSGGSADGGPNAFDGIVPSLTVNYADDKFEGEWYSGYYVATRRPAGNTTLDFLHFWGNAGVKFAKIASVGAHYEQLRNTRNSATDEATNNYKWLGGYVQFALPMGAAARFTTGANVLDGAAGDFYKLNVSFGF